MRDVDMSIFIPTSPAPERDPYHGFGKEEYERREAEKKSMAERWRQARELGRQPNTPNRESWCCVRCHRRFAPGERIWVHFIADSLFATLRCDECHSKIPQEAPPCKQEVPIREVSVDRITSLDQLQSANEQELLPTG